MILIWNLLKKTVEEEQGVLLSSSNVINMSPYFFYQIQAIQLSIWYYVLL